MQRCVFVWQWRRSENWNVVKSIISMLHNCDVQHWWWKRMKWSNCVHTLTCNLTFLIWMSHGHFTQINSSACFYVSLIVMVMFLYIWVDFLLWLRYVACLVSRCGWWWDVYGLLWVIVASHTVFALYHLSMYAYGSISSMFNQWCGSDQGISRLYCCA